jgi:hypothetical protein
MKQLKECQCLSLWVRPAITAGQQGWQSGCEVGWMRTNWILKGQHGNPKDEIDPTSVWLSLTGYLQNELTHFSMELPTWLPRTTRNRRKTWGDLQARNLGQQISNKCTSFHSAWHLPWTFRTQFLQLSSCHPNLTQISPNLESLRKGNLLLGASGSYLLS